MRVLVTGRGSIAQRHVRHLRALRPEMQLAVVARGGAVDPALLPCDSVADFEAGLAWGPDAVIVASVSNRHADELEACLKIGLPCLAEKPLVTSQLQLDRLRAAGPGRAVLVGCNLRYLPALGQLAARLHQGDLGRLVRAQLEVGQNLAQWRPTRELASSYSADAAQGGGVVFDLVHEIDMARWLLGPLRVHAALGGRLGQLTGDADDVHVALLGDAGGAPVTVSLDYISQRPVRRYSLVTENGTLECDIMARRLCLARRDGVEILSDAAADFAVADTYELQMRDWLAAMGDAGYRSHSPLADALETAALMLAMKEAAA
jgi:predicted dehydrogenase